MMPSTGYFKGINCPFYDSGLCERPYCHYRHPKKESSTTTPNDGIESGAMLQILVSAAVQKVLQNTITSTSTSTQVTVVESSSEVCKVSSAPSKVTYNPTPIAELNKMVSADTDDNDDTNEQRKRHIPVPYTPRKPASLPIQRPLDTNGSKPFIYNPPQVKYTPGCPENIKLDQYTPKGTAMEANEKYLPGTEAHLQEYTPKNEMQTISKHNYVPSDKSVSKKKVLEYKPVKVSNKTITPIYQPTPKALVPCFSSDEDEPEIKKFKHLNDLNGLDDLGPEFDILDQILDEENSQEITDSKITNKENSSSQHATANKEPSKKHEGSSKKHKSSSEKHDGKTSNETKKDKSSHSKSDKNDTKIKELGHKSSDKDKSRDKKKDSQSTDVKKHKSPEEIKEKITEEKKEKNTEERKEKKSDEKKIKSPDEKKYKSSEDKKDSHAELKKYKSSGEKRDKSSEKKKHSRLSEKSSKQSENISSKTAEKHSKHSSSSKSRSDSKELKRKSDNHLSSRKSKERKKHRTKETVRNDIPYTDNHIDDTAFASNDEELVDLSESDEDEIALECKRIFDEYVPTEKSVTDMEEIANNNQMEDDSIENEYVPVKKRISRTIDKNIKVIPKPPLKPDYKVSAAQAMAARLEKVKEFHASRNSHESSKSESLQPRQEFPKASISTPNIASNKIRIAHVPYVSTLMNAKRTIPAKIKSNEPSTSSTIVQTNKKGSLRVAHIPNEKFIDRPGVLEPLASKIAANIRSTYLNMMIDECLKIYLSATDAYARAQNEELATSKKCSTVQIYKNSAVLTVSRLRKEFQECNGVKKSGSDCSALQKMPQSTPGNSNVGSWSIVNKNRGLNDYTHELSGPKLYKNISKWILTEEQLIENGFPRPHASGEKGRAVIHGQNKLPPPKGLMRTCCRCKKDYCVNKKGFPVNNEECIYHPKNKYKIRGEAKYQCCSQDNTSDGCCIASCHVYDFVDFENLKGYIKTMPPDYILDDYGVYALDCEMCYTTHGLDLTRVTVINSSCKVVYETLIKPLHPIIDYNTRYSGITEEQMANVKTTLLEVQATLLTMFNSKTILVGHSLESDFKALKLIHDTVIDTSVLFPHKMGPPFKRALRNLSSEYLKKIIQNSVEGHDSAEDATVCMELLIYKLKEDLKTR